MNLKKILLSTIVLLLTNQASADLMKDSKTCKYYTSSAAQSINQDEYHQLVWKCKDIQQQCYDQQTIIYAQQSAILAQYNCGNCSLRDQRDAGQKDVNNVVASQIRVFLQRVATTTSIILLADLQKCKFIF